jgi:hypothetical protein
LTINPEVRFRESFSSPISHDSKTFKLDQSSFPNNGIKEAGAQFALSDAQQSNAPFYPQTLGPIYESQTMNFSAMDFSPFPSMQTPPAYFNDSGFSMMDSMNFKDVIDADINFNLNGNATSYPYYPYYLGRQKTPPSPFPSSDLSSRRSNLS